MGVEDYFVRIDRTLIANKAGQGAADIAAKVRADRPIRSFVGRLLDVHTDEHAWTKGAEGERLVGAELRKLGTEWCVIHDITVGKRGANIDHFVVGPGGAFTINAKNHAGKGVWVAPRTFLVNGHRTDYLRVAVSEGKRATRLLSNALGKPFSVTPVITLIADRLTVKAQPHDVAVVGRGLIRHWLTSRPFVLSTAEIREVAAHAARPETWL